MDIVSHLKLAGQSLLNLLDSESNFMPVKGYEIAHDTGRWWDAVLRLENTIDFVIPAHLEAASLKNLHLLTDNPDALLTNRLDMDCLKPKAKLNPHNFRETLLAFGGLFRYRNSQWAKFQALKLVASMSRSLKPDGSFDFTQMGLWGQVPHTNDPSHTETKSENGWFDGTATSGRALEALVLLYESTQDPRVLDLADKIARHHFEYSINPDGSIREEIANCENVGHNHSYHGTLRGLLLFGLLTSDRQYIDAVERTYRKTIRNNLVKESGWTSHDLGKARFRNDFGDMVGDPASTGDAAQIALWLALRNNCHDLFDDVERYVRARLIPSQLTPEDMSRHPEQVITARNLGAWKIHGPTHGNKGCTPDVLAAVTHSLCDIYQNIVTVTSKEVRINLHLNFENEVVKIMSERKKFATIRVIVKRSNNIMIRIPSWVSLDTITLTVNEKTIPAKRLGKFAFIPKTLVEDGAEIILKHELPEKITEEVMPSGRTYKFKWSGDEIVGSSPQDTSFPFYPELSAILSSRE